MPLLRKKRLHRFRARERCRGHGSGLEFQEDYCLNYSKLPSGTLRVTEVETCSLIDFDLMKKVGWPYDLLVI